MQLNDFFRKAPAFSMLLSLSALARLAISATVLGGSFAGVGPAAGGVETAAAVPDDDDGAG